MSLPGQAGVQPAPQHQEVRAVSQSRFEIPVFSHMYERLHRKPLQYQCATASVELCSVYYKSFAIASTCNSVIFKRSVCGFCLAITWP